MSDQQPQPQSKRKSTWVLLGGAIVALGAYAAAAGNIETRLRDWCPWLFPATLSAVTGEPAYDQGFLSADLELSTGKPTVDVQQIALVYYVPEAERNNSDESCPAEWCGINKRIGTSTNVREIFERKGLYHRSPKAEISSSSLYRIGVPAEGRLGQFQKRGNGPTAVVPLAIESVVKDHNGLEHRSRYVIGYVAMLSNECRDLTSKGAFKRKVDLLEGRQETIVDFYSELEKFGLPHVEECKKAQP